MSSTFENSCAACGNEYIRAHMSPVLCTTGPRKGQPKKDGSCFRVGESGKPFVQLRFKAEEIFKHSSDGQDVEVAYENPRDSCSHYAYSNMTLHMCTACGTIKSFS